MEDFSKTLVTFIKKFNETQDYKDKAQEAFKHLTETKDVLTDNMMKLIERDGKLDKLLVSLILKAL